MDRSPDVGRVRRGGTRRESGAGKDVGLGGEVPRRAAVNFAAGAVAAGAFSQSSLASSSSRSQTRLE